MRVHRARSRAAAGRHAVCRRPARRNFLAPASCRSDYALAECRRRGCVAPDRRLDHGVRGQLSITLDAHTLGPTWTLGGRAEIRRLHRWDLPMRADNPALNLQVLANGSRKFPKLISRSNVANAALQCAGRRRSLVGSGASRRNAAEPPAFVITSSGIEMEDAHRVDSCIPSECFGSARAARQDRRSSHSYPAGRCARSAARCKPPAFLSKAEASAPRCEPARHD